MQHEPGTFSRASEDVIKQRKIVRARRGLQASAPPSDNPANPFANIQLLPTKEGPETETEEHKGNDADTEAKTAQVTKKGPDEREEKLNNEKEENQSDKQQEIGDKDQDSKGLVANTSQAGVGNPTGGFGGFGGFGALASNSGEGLVFGLNSGSSTGFGGFGGLGRPSIDILLHPPSYFDYVPAYP